LGNLLVGVDGSSFIFFLRLGLILEGLVCESIDGELLDEGVNIIIFDGMVGDGSINFYFLDGIW